MTVTYAGLCSCVYQFCYSLEELRGTSSWKGLPMSNLIIISVCFEKER